MSKQKKDETPPEVTSQEETSPRQRDADNGPRKVRLKRAQSLERLRDRVQAAAEELHRLRAENEQLAARIEALESRPHLDVEGTVLAFDEDPDAIRRKVEGFIDAIDRYLARDREEA